MPSSTSRLRISRGGCTRRWIALAGMTAGLTVFVVDFAAVVAAAGAELFAAGVITNFAGTRSAAKRDVWLPSRLGDDKIVVAGPAAMELVDAFSNEISRGASESAIRQASDIPVNNSGAGLHIRVARGRFSSRI